MATNNILRPVQICERLNISISTLYRWCAAGDFPVKKIKFGRGSVGFRESDLEAYLKSCEQEVESK